jgi:hypothetical protein
MLRMRDHGVEDYAALRDMDATDVGVLGDDDRACLKELGQYLVDTDAGQRFAIWLLHKHFEPAPGEVFVERPYTAPRRTETTLVERSAFAEQALSTTAIRFDDALSAGVGVIGMEFSEAAGLGSTSPLSADDETVLAGIAERLQAHGKTERFGVKLIRNPLGLSERELLLETCDSAHRTLHCDVSERDAIPGGQTVIETTWQFKLVQGETEPIVMQDCTAGCTPVGEGHDLGHKASQTDNNDDDI